MNWFETESQFLDVDVELVHEAEISKNPASVSLILHTVHLFVCT